MADSAALWAMREAVLDRRGEVETDCREEVLRAAKAAGLSSEQAATMLQVNTTLNTMRGAIEALVAHEAGESGFAEAYLGELAVRSAALFISGLPPGRPRARVLKHLTRGTESVLGRMVASGSGLNTEWK